MAVSKKIPIIFACSHLELPFAVFITDLVTVFDAILTSRQTREELQCLYENLMSNNFRETAVMKKISIVN